MKTEQRERNYRAYRRLVSIGLCVLSVSFVCFGSFGKSYTNGLDDKPTKLSSSEMNSYRGWDTVCANGCVSDCSGTNPNCGNGICNIPCSSTEAIVYHGPIVRCDGSGTVKCTTGALTPCTETYECVVDSGTLFHLCDVALTLKCVVFPQPTTCYTCIQTGQPNVTLVRPGSC